jgi:hypothetical protein
VEALEANQEEFAKLLGKESGKPPQGVGIELYLCGVQIRKTVEFRVKEEVVEDTDEVSLSLLVK